MQRGCVPDPLHAVRTRLAQILDRAGMDASCMWRSEHLCECYIQIHSRMQPQMSLKSSDLRNSKCIQPISHWDRRTKGWEWHCHVSLDILEDLSRFTFLEGDLPYMVRTLLAQRQDHPGRTWTQTQCLSSTGATLAYIITSDAYII